MAANDLIINDNKKYKSRMPYFYQANHINDKYKNLGYNYKGNILKNSTSPELWANPLQYGMYEQIENMIYFLIEKVKMIKKSYSIAIEKNSSNLN